jgi:hypothetical protein
MSCSDSNVRLGINRSISMNELLSLIPMTSVGYGFMLLSTRRRHCGVAIDGDD